MRQRGGGKRRWQSDGGLSAVSSPDTADSWQWTPLQTTRRAFTPARVESTLLYTARSATTWETWQWRVGKNLRTRARLRKFLDSSCYQSGDSPLQQRSLQLQLQRVSPGQIVSTLLISKQSHNPLQSLVHTFWSRLQNFSDSSYAALVPTLINGLWLLLHWKIFKGWFFTPGSAENDC